MTGKIPKTKLKSNLVRLRAESLGTFLVDTVGQSCGDDDLSDIIFVCGDDLKPIKGHKVILRSCSSFLARTVECSGSIRSPHPVIPLIVLKEIPGNDIRDILKFIYKGNVVIEKSRIPSLLKTAEFLEIKHLSEVMADADTSPNKKHEPEENGTANDLLNLKQPELEEKKENSINEPAKAQSSAGSEEESSRDKSAENQNEVKKNGTDNLCDNKDNDMKSDAKNELVTEKDSEKDVPEVNGSIESQPDPTASVHDSKDSLGSPMELGDDELNSVSQASSPVDSLSNSQSQPDRSTKMNLKFEFFGNFKTIKYDDHKDFQRKKAKEEPEEGELTKDIEEAENIIDLTQDEIDE